MKLKLTACLILLWGAAQAADVSMEYKDAAKEQAAKREDALSKLNHYGSAVMGAGEPSYAARMSVERAEVLQLIGQNFSQYVYVAVPENMRKLRLGMPTPADKSVIAGQLVTHVTTSLAARGFNIVMPHMSRDRMSLSQQTFPLTGATTPATGFTQLAKGVWVHDSSSKLRTLPIAPDTPLKLLQLSLSVSLTNPYPAEPSTYGMPGKSRILQSVTQHYYVLDEL